MSGRSGDSGGASIAHSHRTTDVDEPMSPPTPRGGVREPSERDERKRGTAKRAHDDDAWGGLSATARHEGKTRACVHD